LSWLRFLSLTVACFCASNGPIHGCIQALWQFLPDSVFDKRRQANVDVVVRGQAGRSALRNRARVVGDDTFTVCCSATMCRRRIEPGVLVTGGYARVLPHDEELAAQAVISRQAGLLTELWWSGDGVVMAVMAPATRWMILALAAISTTGTIDAQIPVR
jgi:hypothetical protein